MPGSGSPAGRNMLPRSCARCRARRVRCDRQGPCGNCAKAGTECIFPPGPGRAPKRPRHARDPRVSEQIQKLEHMVSQMKLQSDLVRQNSHECGKLLIDETRSCYVGNMFLPMILREVSLFLTSWPFGMRLVLTHLAPRLQSSKICSTNPVLKMRLSLNPLIALDQVSGYLAITPVHIPCEIIIQSHPSHLSCGRRSRKMLHP